MTDPLCIAYTPWIPIRVADGSTLMASPVDLPDLHAREREEGPLQIAWGRPDLRIATLELLIGLLAVAFPQTREGRHLALLRDPPGRATLADALKPLAPYLTLDGDGPRFCQDMEELDGDLPLDGLLLDGPGKNTIEQQKDVFVKAGRIDVLCRPAAAVALYAQQAFSLGVGSGHRTSMRGGGPLTTLVVPPPPPEREWPTLWERVWANLPVNRDYAPPEDLTRVFSWAAPTWTSEKDPVSKKDRLVDCLPEGPLDRPWGHPLQAFFGMPSRIRLRFAPAGGRRCALTGMEDPVVATGFAKVKLGVRYGPSWRHPLTPYYTDKKGQTLPVHPHSTRFGYRDWAGLVLGGAGTFEAAVVAQARNRPEMDGGHILAAGYVTDSATARDYLEADLPLFAELDETRRKILSREAELLVAGEDRAEGQLRSALRRALDAEGRSTPPPEPMAHLRGATAEAFEATLRRLQRLDPEEADTRGDLRLAWANRLRVAALEAFDQVFPPMVITGRPPAQQARIARERNGLGLALAGFGKGGRMHYRGLDLVPPTPRKDAA